MHTTGPHQLLARSAARPCLCFTLQVHASSRPSANEQRQRSSVVLARATPDVHTKQRAVAEMTIQELDENYCDDFVCTSSPAVEQTVRSLAKDITKFKASSVQWRVQRCTDACNMPSCHVSLTTTCRLHMRDPRCLAADTCCYVCFAALSSTPTSSNQT